MAKLMGIFICPDIHELSLLSFIEKLKRPRRATLGRIAVKQRIQGFLVSYEKKFPGCSTDEDTLNNIIMMMEDMKFCIALDSSESEAYNQHVDAFLFPSLRPFGTFRWNFMQSMNLLTMGRRIKQVHGSAIIGCWFCNLQVIHPRC